jgi:oligosaccharide repeat unit polymerase
MIVIPAFSIFWNGNEEYGKYTDIMRVDYDRAALVNFLMSVTFVFNLFLGYFLASTFFFKGKFNKFILKYHIDVFNHRRIRLKKIIYFLVIVSGFFVLHELFFGFGIKKLISLGSDIGQAEFRVMGWDEGSKKLDLIIQIIRRNILPYCTILFFFQMKIFFNDKFWFYLSALLLLISSVQSLDRAPLLSLIIMVILIYLSLHNKLYKGLFRVAMTLLILPFFGGFLTYIQYNRLDFTYSDLWGSSFDFLYSRVFFSPTWLSIELCFSWFPKTYDFLFLKFSRLGFIFGNEYIGTFSDQSYFVAPVTVVGDIWRNFGLIGIIIQSILLGVLFRIWSFWIKRSPFDIAIAISFLVVSLSFYFVYGGFYSLGVFFQIFYITSILFFSSKRFKASVFG